MKKLILIASIAFLVLPAIAQDANCLPESVYSDSAFNTETARVIRNKFSMSNSPIYKGTYLRQVAISTFQENTKDGKVVSRDISFTVAKKNEKGKCVLMKVKIRQDALLDNKGWGKPYVEGAMPQSGTVDCDCVMKAKDWYRA
ncbi:MAG: hypothetical protein ACK40M_03840 [Flavobacteriales bacterium]